MPLYMDVHTIEGGVTEADVADAHAADLTKQGAHDVNYLRYWVDEEAGKIFCLVQAPSAEAASTVHREAHGTPPRSSSGPSPSSRPNAVATAQVRSPFSNGTPEARSVVSDSAASTSATRIPPRSRA
jgi:hypothetical protein